MLRNNGPDLLEHSVRRPQDGTCSHPVLLYYMSTHIPHIPNTKRPVCAFQDKVGKWVTLYVGVFEELTHPNSVHWSILSQ